MLAPFQQFARQNSDLPTISYNYPTPDCRRRCDNLQISIPFDTGYLLYSHSLRHRTVPRLSRASYIDRVNLGKTSLQVHCHFVYNRISFSQVLFIIITKNIIFKRGISRATPSTRRTGLSST